MKRRRFGTLFSTPVLLCTLPLSSSDAQGLSYGYRAGDTTRFSEALRLDVTSTGPAGSMQATITRDAHIVFAFVRADSIRAWYDSLSIEAAGPTSRRSINAQGALRLQFALRMAPDGVTRTLSAPVFPASLRNLGDLNPQFDDILPALPAVDSVPGAVRTDTIFQRETQSGDRQSSIRRVVQSIYDRDTTIAGERAIVLTQRTTMHIERTAPVQSGTYTARLVLDGIEEGIAIVSRQGRLLHRTRSGEAHGTVAYKAGATDVSVPQHYRYRITLHTPR